METLDDLLQKPEEEISLTKVLFEVAKCPDLNNDFDIKEYEAKINQMADDLKQRIDGERRPEKIIRIINNYLFEEKGFDIDYFNFFPNEVLDDKKGNCVGLSILYLVLAEKLDLPIYGISLPKHMIVRWSDGKFKRNIETNEKGKEYPDSYYKTEYKIPQESIEKGVYLRELSKKEVIGGVLNALGVDYRDEAENLVCFSDDEEDYDKAIQYFTKAIQYFTKALELNPYLVEAYTNLGWAHFEKRDYDKAIQYFTKALELDPNSDDAYRGLARVYSAKGDSKKATQYRTKAVKIGRPYI